MISFKKQLITGSLILGALAVPALGLADDTAAAATPVATPTPLSWYQKITVGGYLDEYYQMNFNNPESTGYTAAPDGARVFDNTSNEFTFGGGELTLKQSDSASGTGYFVDLLMGPAAGIYNVDGATKDSVELGQAYVTQSFGNATFTLGKFGTPIGYEVTYLPSNANFSRSLLYFNEPLYHVGLELAYTLPMSWTATGWIDDGNSTDGAASSGRDYGLQLAYSGIKNLNLTGTWYLQNYLTTGGIPFVLAPTTDVDSSVNWANLVATYTANSEWNFAGEYLFKSFDVLGDPLYDNFIDGNTGFPNYNTENMGYALYATYAPSSVANLSISPRFEQWFNPTAGIPLNPFTGSNIGGYVGANSTAVFNDYTLTVKYQMGPLAHMLEYRADASNANIFPTNNTNGNYAEPFNSKIQQSLTYAAVYSF